MKNPSVMQLQNEAAARVRQMEEHAKRLVREHPVNIYRGTTFTPPPPRETVCEVPPPMVCEPEPPVCVPQKEPPCVPQKANKGGVLAWVCDDPERTLLLLLAVVLWQNGAPPELLLALLYVAL